MAYLWHRGSTVEVVIQQAARASSSMCTLKLETMKYGVTLVSGQLCLVSIVESKTLVVTKVDKPGERIRW